MIHFGPFGSFRWPGSLYFASVWYILMIILVHLIGFDSFWWFILIHLDHFSDQVLSILLNFADFGWFWHILSIDFGSFQFLLMIHFGPFASIFVNFELFWVILIHFHSFYNSFWSICFILDNWLISIFDNSIHFGWFRSIFIHFDVSFWSISFIFIQLM